MNHKTKFLVLLAALAGTFFFIATSQAESGTDGHTTWMTDFEASMAKAKVENKPILVNFTGSDWCGWCIKLEKEVFSRKAFQDYAAENFVLVEIDFPSNRIEQSAELKAQNEALVGKYGIRGFPTILILDADGNVIEETGYRRGGAEAYVEHLEEILAANENLAAEG